MKIWIFQIDEFYEKIVTELGIADVTSMVASVHKSNVSWHFGYRFVLFVIDVVLYLCL